MRAARKAARTFQAVPPSVPLDSAAGDSVIRKSGTVARSPGIYLLGHTHKRARVRIYVFQKGKKRAAFTNCSKNIDKIRGTESGTKAARQKITVPKTVPLAGRATPIDGRKEPFNDI